MKSATSLVYSAALAAFISIAGSVIAQPSPPYDATESRLERLPLIETPSTVVEGDTFVVLYSGDSGWSSTARGFAAALAAGGEPVAGLDSLRYYLQYQPPETAAADLAAVIEHYARLWNRPKVILVGYSFGADGLPLIVEKLSADERAKVRLVALVSPADRADMAFRILSWFDMTLPGARPLAPALLTLGSIPAVCIHAEHDPREACDRFPPQVITSVGLPGGHRYEGQYEAVAQIIRSFAGLAAPDAVTPASSP